MEKKIPHVSRRMIGKVNIFDLFGSVDTAWSSRIKDYIESYIKSCNFQHVIINLHGITTLKREHAQDIVNVLAGTKKSAVYFDSPELLTEFRYDIQEKNPVLCTTPDEILALFGSEMVERDKIIQFNDRRKTIRIKTALQADIIFRDVRGGTIESKAIVTNLSENGLFAEYLDLDCSVEIENLDYFKNLMLEIAIQNPDPNEKEMLRRTGKILRIEFSGAQTGIAIEFGPEK